MTEEIIRMRLDARLVADGAFVTRARAQGAIRAGLVRVGGHVVTRPAKMVTKDDAVSAHGDIHDFVSRGALKLKAALSAFPIEISGVCALDLGASTGGFTEVLLRAGAARVYAVDVGSAQLHPRIASDPRVISLEKTNARDLAPALVPEPIGIIVADLSFISLRKALPASMKLLASGAAIVALVKPQFEVGRAHVGKGGIVRGGAENHEAVAEAVLAWLVDAYRMRPLGIIESPISGGDGNREFLIGAIAEG